MKTIEKEFTLPQLEEGNYWAALDPKDSTIIIAQGNDPGKVAEEANESGKDYILTYIPDRNETYIF